MIEKVFEIWLGEKSNCYTSLYIVVQDQEPDITTMIITASWKVKTRKSLEHGRPASLAYAQANNKMIWFQQRWKVKTQTCD